MRNTPDDPNDLGLAMTFLRQSGNPNDVVLHVRPDLLAPQIQDEITRVKREIAHLTDSIEELNSKSYDIQTFSDNALNLDNLKITIETMSEQISEMEIECYNLKQIAEEKERVLGTGASRQEFRDLADLSSKINQLKADRAFNVHLLELEAAFNSPNSLPECIKLHKEILESKRILTRKQDQLEELISYQMAILRKASII